MHRHDPLPVSETGLAARLLSGLLILAAFPAVGQRLEVLHTFSDLSGPNATNTDGANPGSELTISGSTLYGTAQYGGGAGAGALFAINSDGSGFTAIHHFTAGAGGANPLAGLALALDGNALFGSASSGGISGSGMLFSIAITGSGFSVLHNFTARANNSFGVLTNSDGADPVTSLMLVGNTLFGSADLGGTSGHGTLYSLNTSGGGFANLHSFSSGTGGAHAASALVLVGGMLYGTDYSNLGNGTVFAINTNGNSFTNYYAFSIGHVNSSGVLTNDDGANPQAPLVLAGGTLYGTAMKGGIVGNGTVFAINTDGSGFTTLHAFTKGAYGPQGRYLNTDGAQPSAGLVLSGDYLFGSASGGGPFGNGTLFAMRTDGSEFKVLYSFSATPSYPQPQTNSEGANPSGSLLMIGNALYGTASYGGLSGNGTVFRLAPALTGPPLAVASTGAQVLLTWPATTTVFNLQSAPDPGGPFTNVPNAMSPYTNPISGDRLFFRLSQ